LGIDDRLCLLRAGVYGGENPWCVGQPFGGNSFKLGPAWDRVCCRAVSSRWGQILWSDMCKSLTLSIGLETLIQNPDLVTL